MDNISNKIKPLCLKCITNIPTIIYFNNRYELKCNCGYRNNYLSIGEYVKEYNNQTELVSYPTDDTKTIDISFYKERM